MRRALRVWLWRRPAAMPSVPVGLLGRPAAAPLALPQGLAKVRGGAGGPVPAPRDVGRPKASAEGPRGGPGGATSRLRAAPSAQRPRGPGHRPRCGVVAALAPQIFPDSFRDEGGEVGVYFEAAGVIVTLILLGQVLELRARSRTGAAIKELLGLAAKTARRIRADGSDEDIPLEAVRAGDRVRVRPGEKVPWAKLPFLEKVHLNCSFS